MPNIWELIGNGCKQIPFQRNKIFACLFFSVLLISCGTETGGGTALNLHTRTGHDYDHCVNRRAYIMTDTERRMIEMGLVEIKSVDSSIHVNMKYATEDNFLKMPVYGDFKRAYLQPDVADKLVNAQKYLKELRPDLSLIVFDAARTVYIQQMIWDSLKVPIAEKGKFAANPKYGSLHNFGAAVDISLCDSIGNELDMGSPFDYFGELAYSVAEQKLLSEGKLTQEQVDRRRLLRQVMQRAGFFNIQTEWWHFNSCYREEAIKKYQIIE